MRLIDADALIEDLNLLLEETQTKTGCSFSDDVSFGEVLSCIEGQDTEYPFTEQDVREAFNSGYSCGMENKDGWIPVSERLPKVDNISKRVLVTTSWGVVKEAYYCVDHWSIDDIDYKFSVAAWMPLPGPWKGEEE